MRDMKPIGTAPAKFICRPGIAENRAFERQFAKCTAEDGKAGVGLLLRLLRIRSPLREISK
jgi:hypothetical protein